MMRELLDVVHHTVELPLGIHFALASERKAIKALVVAQVAKHGLHGGNAPAVKRPALCRVDAPSHRLGVPEC